MPDKQGWEIQPVRRPTLLHAACDRKVENTPAGKTAHLEVCPALQQARDEQRQRAKEATQRIRKINRDRAETRNNNRREEPSVDGRLLASDRSTG